MGGGGRREQADRLKGREFRWMGRGIGGWGCWWLDRGREVRELWWMDGAGGGGDLWLMGGGTGGWVVGNVRRCSRYRRCGMPFGVAILLRFQRRAAFESCGLSCRFCAFVGKGFCANGIPT